jgi:hypothetical protein
MTGDSREVELLIPFTKIAHVCSGYESGSRILLVGNSSEIDVEESVGEIWRMMKEMK